MAGEHERFVSPLAERVATDAMVRLWGPQRKFSTWRRCWIALAEAEREAWEGESSGEALTGDAVVSEEDGFRGWPLSRRLLATIKKRGLRQKDVATLFGVSAVAVTYWVKGQNSHGRKKLIPDRLAPLLIRWIETGEAPTPEELAASKGEAK